MPRLIDADTLKAEWKMGEDCEKCERNARECRYNDFSRMDICGMLDDAPTVDAIPVAWLKSIKETMMRQSRNRAETCVLARVIEMWEKECEDQDG